MDEGPGEAPPPAPIGRRTISRFLGRVVDLAKQHSTALFSVLVMLLVNVVFITAIVLQYRLQRLRLILFYVFFMLMYAALYLWRRLRAHRRRHARFRSGLWYAAIGLAICMSALFFNTFAPDAGRLPLAIAAWLLLVAPACWCLYQILVLHIEDAEAAGQQGQAELELTQMPEASELAMASRSTPTLLPTP